MPTPRSRFAVPVLALVAGLVSPVRAETAAPPAAWNLRDHIPLEEIVVQSHRGAGSLAPENSLEAFEEAWTLGTIPEADARTTRDGVIVPFHDNDFKRILPKAPAERRRQGVADLDWADLKTLDVGAWKGPQFVGQHIPRLADAYAVLARRPGRKLYVDVKNIDLAQLAKESVAVHPQLILASTDYALTRQWKSLAPKSATLLWMGGDEAKLSRRLDELRQSDFADVDQLQIHVRVAKDGTLSPRPEFLRAVGEELRRHGVLFQVFPWECQDPEVYRQLMDLGVASFTTDYPAVTMQAIRDYYAAAESRSAP
jgi:glycerophosphoryl diester phosphodiesterase